MFPLSVYMYHQMKYYFNCAYQSAVPHAMILFVGEDSSTVAVVAEQLAVFRILRALKMVAGKFVW